MTCSKSLLRLAFGESSATWGPVVSMAGAKCLYSESQRYFVPLSR